MTAAASHPVVRLDFGPQPRVVGGARAPLGVELRDPDNAIVGGGSLADVARWLSANGYRWVPGSNGLWCQPR